MIKTNIIIFCYNRPLHLKKLLTKIREIKKRKIYLISDGPKNIKDKIKVNLVRKEIKKSNIKFFKKKYLKKNVGVRKIFELGLNWVFKYQREIIILEDDIIPAKSFFKFCDHMLSKYKENKNISQITGCNVNDKITKNLKNDYFLSKYSNIWGWATWKNRWSDYDNNFKNVKNLINSKKFINSCLSINEYKFWKKYFIIHYKNKNIGTWDYAWTYTNFLKERYSIVSKINLIENTGIEEGTGKNPKKLKNLKKKEIKKKILHPKKLTINNTYDLYSSNNIYSLPKILWRIKNKLDFFN